MYCIYKYYFNLNYISNNFILIIMVYKESIYILSEYFLQATKIRIQINIIHAHTGLAHTGLAHTFHSAHFLAKVRKSLSK